MQCYCCLWKYVSIYRCLVKMYGHLQCISCYHFYGLLINLQMVGNSVLQSHTHGLSFPCTSSRKGIDESYKRSSMSWWQTRIMLSVFSRWRRMCNCDTSASWTDTLTLNVCASAALAAPTISAFYRAAPSFAACLTIVYTCAYRLCKICTVQLLGSYNICVLLLLCKTFDTVIANRSSADLNFFEFW